MDSFVYQSLTSYYHALGRLGYVSDRKMSSLLLLVFLYNLLYHDYRGYVSREDYHAVEKALDCLYGSNCLIPYPDYLKMGKLRLGDMTELAQRTKALEENDKLLDQRILDNDVLIEDNVRRIDEHGTRLDDHDAHLSQHDDHLSQHDDQIAQHTRMLDDHESRIVELRRDVDNHEGRLVDLEAETRDHEARITTMEETKVMKKNKYVGEISDISGIPDLDISDVNP